MGYPFYYNYKKPAFVGLNFGNSEADKDIPIDIMKFLFVGADILIPDDKTFHKYLSDDEIKGRAGKLYEICEIIKETYNLENKIILSSDLDNGEIDFLKDKFKEEYENNENLRREIKSYFPNKSSEEYVLGESAICVYMSKEMGYETKIGPPSEKKFDIIIDGICKQERAYLRFSYTIPAFSLQTGHKVNHKMEPYEVTDYMATSMSHKGVHPTRDRLLFSDSFFDIFMKMRFRKFPKTLRNLTILSKTADIILNENNENIEIPKDETELNKEAINNLFEYIYIPLMKNLKTRQTN